MPARGLHQQRDSQSARDWPTGVDRLHHRRAFPKNEGFIQQLNAVGAVADVVEIGVPFTDPMADGTTIQRSSRVALEQGVSLRWILQELSRAEVKPQSAVDVDELSESVARLRHRQVA